jgi:hypothetical protein
MVVVVKSVNVVLRIAVPVLMETPLVLIELDAVGIAVPAAIFHTLIVQVPVSTRMLQACIVPPEGTLTYPVSPEANATPPPSKDVPKP